MRFIMALIVVLASCSCAVVSRVVPPAPSAEDVMVMSSVRLQVICPLSGDQFAGSGVAVSSRHVLTAKHVADACGPKDQFTLINALLWNGRVIPMVLDVVSQEGRDVARLVVDGAYSPFRVHARLSRWVPQFKEELCKIAGGVDVHERIINCGMANRVFDSGPLHGQIQVTMHGVGGNSGAAIFDADGFVVGILWGGVNGPFFENYILANLSAYLLDLEPEEELED